MEWEEEILDAEGKVKGVRFYDDSPREPDSFDRHPGRTLILHLHHPTLGDGHLNPVIREALLEYLAGLDRGDYGMGKTDSVELPSGARMDTFAFGPGVY